MKYRLITLFLFLYQYNYAQEIVNFDHDDLPLLITSAKYDTPWDLPEDHQRETAIERAFANAVTIIKNCKQDLILKQLLCLKASSDCMSSNYTHYNSKLVGEILCQEEKKENGKNADFPFSEISTTIQILYSTVSSVHDAYSYTHSSGSLRSEYSTKKETYDFKVEIFPHIFEEQAFELKGETGEGESWAYDITEGLLYLILHEFGHCELYIARQINSEKYKNKFSFTRYDDILWMSDEEEEEWADNFASELIRCY